MAGTRAEKGYAGLGREFVAATMNLATNAAISASERSTRSAAAFYFSSSPDERAKVSDRTLSDWARTLKRFNESKGSKSCKVHDHDEDDDHDDKHDGHGEGSHAHDS
jgi:hypothetical protein